MESKVKVNGTEAGAVIIVSDNNPNYGHIRVSQERVSFDDNGFAKFKNISALVLGTIEDLKKLGWSKDQEIDGRIVEKDSLKPFNTKKPERDLKIAGKTGVVCMVNNKPIYSKTIFTTNLTAIDEKLAHTNRDEIKLVLNEMREQEKSIVETEDFTL